MERRLDHIAIVVRDTEAALRFWRDLLGLQPSGTQIIEDQEVQVTFLPVGNTHIELIEPTNPTSGVARYLDKTGAASALHHLCFEVPDVMAMLDEARNRELPLIDKQPRKGAYGEPIAFLHPRASGGVLVELLQAEQTDDAH